MYPLEMRKADEGYFLVKPNGAVMSAAEWDRVKKQVNLYYRPASRAVNVRHTPDDERLTIALYDSVVENYPFTKTHKNILTIKREYEEMNRLHRVDGRDYATIEFIIAWSQRDPFWRQNIRSVKKLRQKFDDLLIRAKVDIDRTQVVDI